MKIITSVTRCAPTSSNCKNRNRATGILYSIIIPLFFDFIPFLKNKKKAKNPDTLLLLA